MPLKDANLNKKRPSFGGCVVLFPQRSGRFAITAYNFLRRRHHIYAIMDKLIQFVHRPLNRRRLLELLAAVSHLGL